MGISRAADRALEHLGGGEYQIVEHHYCQGDARTWARLRRQARGGPVVTETRIEVDGKAPETFVCVSDAALTSTRILTPAEWEHERNTGKPAEVEFFDYVRVVERESNTRTREPRARKIDGPVQGY